MYFITILWRGKQGQWEGGEGGGREGPEVREGEEGREGRLIFHTHRVET